jgi:DNA end-binding protein Ku
VRASCGGLILVLLGVVGDEIGKGYELTKTQVIPISDEELQALPLPTAKAIEIVAFVPLDTVDPIRIGEGYYLAPAQPVAAKPYKLLVQALGRSAKVAVAKYAWSGRERLGLLRVRDDVIVLHAMRWPDEIRDPAELLPPPVDVSDDEIEGALTLMDSMTRDDLEGDDFRDTYTEALQEIIEAKREDKPLPEAPELGARARPAGRPDGHAERLRRPGQGLSRRGRRRARAAEAGIGRADEGWSGGSWPSGKTWGHGEARRGASVARPMAHVHRLLPQRRGGGG